MAGGDAKMADYFVFLTDVTTEQVHDALIQTGATPRVHYSMEEGHRRSGLKTDTKPEDFLQGDPVVISIFWQEGDSWIERPYQDFVQERVDVDGTFVVRPWTPSFVFHGSGALYSSGTGCIACPCDCAGGIIADNRFPLYEPKPEVKDARILASSSGDKSIRMVRANTGETLRTLTGHSSDVYRLAFSPGGKRLVSCSQDKTIRIWDAATGKVEAVLRGHTGAVYSATLLPRRNILVSVSDDRTLRVWQAPTGEPLGLLKSHEDAVYAVAASPDDRIVVSAGADKKILSWSTADIVSSAPLVSPELRSRPMEIQHDASPTRRLSLEAPRIRPAPRGSPDAAGLPCPASGTRADPDHPPQSASGG